MSNKKTPKLDFKKKKDNTLKSLREVECFLNKTCRCCKLGTIAKFLKK